MQRNTVWKACAIGVLMLVGLACDNRQPGDAGIAFVTNNPSDFWKIATKGVEKAEKEFGIKCEVRMPTDTADQQRIVEDLIARGVTGMAISPINPANQTAMLNQACEKMHVICHDSDAADSNRLCYVGTINYKAGREAGKLIREVLPDGGKIMVFVGTMDAQNAQDRYRGVVDEIKGTKIEIVDTRTDNTDRARAKQNVEDTLTAIPDIACLVGLWEYNGPAILNAVKDAGKAGKIPIVCFDENVDTLQGVRDGHIHATVVQSPFLFGYHSVRILKALADGDRSVIPANQIYEIPVKIVRKDNVDAFQKELQALMQ